MGLSEMVRKAKVMGTGMTPKGCNTPIGESFKAKKGFITGMPSAIYQVVAP
jgi:hypothetical protein